MNNDLLYTAATAFQKLLSVKYRIILGKKGKSFELVISFREDNFFHLSGLNKISGSHLNKLPRAKIFNSILKRDISDSIVNNYSSAPQIIKRITALSRLEELLDKEDTAFFKYDRTKVAFSKIEADFLAKGMIDNEQIIFSFFVRQLSNEYYVNSIFPITTYDFSEQQAAYTVLLKEKIFDYGSIILYKHKNFAARRINESLS